MPGFPLSPELCKRIVQWSSPRPGVLGALCLTCKSLQREAEIKLYESLIFVDTRVAYLAFRTISSHERFGLYVRHLVFDPRPQSPAISTSFWGTFQVALSRMDNLEFFSISDTTYSNSWILDTAKFQLRELKVGFCWDESFLCFLKTQQKLRFLSFFDQFDDRSRLRIPSPCLPSLQMYEGSLMTAAQLVSSPITHMQIVVDRDVMPLLIATLPRLSKLHTTLRSLSILEVPEELSAKMLSIISRACPLVRYLGLLRLPTHNVRFPISSLCLLTFLLSATKFITLSCTCITCAAWTLTLPGGTPNPVWLRRGHLPQNLGCIVPHWR